MKRKITYGIIGCGEIAVNTAKAIAHSENSELGMVQDVNEDMAEDLADKYGVPYCLTWDKLLSNRCLDAVYVATPHHLHADAAVQAAESGKHVLVEKPISTTLRDADRMIKAAADAGRALGVAFCGRFTERAERVRRIIDDGVLGRIVALDFGEYTWKPQSYWSGGWTGRVKTSWRESKEKAGGGVLIMNVIHTIDLLRYLTGLEAESVAAQYDTFKTDVEVEDHLVAVLRYRGGAVGCLKTSTIAEGKAPPGAFEGDRIIGLDGQLLLTKESIRLFLSSEYENLPGRQWHTIHTGDPWSGREKFLTAFSKALISGKAPPVTGEDGRKALEICLAAYRSGAEGRLVTLPLEE